MLDSPIDPLVISRTPIRRVITRRSRRMNGRFASKKMGRGLVWESSNEFAFLTLAELDLDVTEIYAQPIQLTLDTPSGQRRHIPDFAIIRNGLLELHEVKPDEDANDPGILELARSATQFVAAHGAVYGLALAATLKAEPRLRRAQAVMRRLHDSVPDVVRMATISSLQDDGPCSIQSLLEKTTRWNLRLEQVMTLIAHNAVFHDYGEDLTRHSIVAAERPPGHKQHLLPHPSAWTADNVAA